MSDQGVTGRYPLFVGIAAATAFLWCLSIADPCLVNFLRGTGDPAANPVAITTCRYDAEQGLTSVTVGDVIVRIAALFLLAGITALVVALVDPARRRRNVVAVMLAGYAVGCLAYAGLRAFGLGFDPSILSFYLVEWFVISLVVTIAAAIGFALAATTWSEYP